MVLDATGANSRIREAHGPRDQTPRAAPIAGASATCASRRRSPPSAGPGRRALQRGPRRLAAPDGRRRLAPRLPDGRKTADPEAISRPEVAGARLRAQSAPASSSSSSGSVRTSTATTCSRPSASAAPSSSATRRTWSPPFGARGGNNGIQDAANLGWKLALVLARRGRRGAARQLPRRALPGGDGEPEGLPAHRALPRAAQPRRAPNPPRRLTTLARSHEFARAPVQHGPDGAGQRLSALALGDGWCALGCRTSPSTARP